MTDEEAPLVLETPGGLSVSYRGRLLYSGREPSRLPKRVAESCDRGPSRLHLVPSPLLWYGVPELLGAMGEGSAVLCVEADPALARLARSRMPPELERDGRLAFVEGRSIEAAVGAAAALGAFRRCSLAPLSGGEALDSALYRAMAAALGAAFESDWRNRAALMTLGDRWARNLFDNLATLPETAPEPAPRLAGPLVVCGAGPSLEEALPFISRESGRGRLRVVACDTALGSLLACGVAPDLVVCLEAQAHNLADFTCLGERPVPLAVDLSSHPASLRTVRGPKHLSFVRITRSLFLDRAGEALRAAGVPFLELPPLGSVGVHALRLAGLLSEGPILAAGLDFCFEPGKTHARGCPSLLAEAGRLGRLTRWPGQFATSFRDRNIRLHEGEASGEGPARPLITDPILLSYASLAAEAPSQAAGPELLDVRGRGPDIGMRRITLAQAADLVESLPPRASAQPEPLPHDAAARRRSCAAVAGFLRGEAARLAALRRGLRGSGPPDRGEIARLVAEADYLSWSFPDRGRSRELEQDYLNRLVPRLEYWDARIEALLSGS